MHHSTWFRITLPLALLASSLLASAVAHAYSNGPPDGYAGNPPFFETCEACHSGGPGDGQLALLDVPSGGYTPGQRYTFRIELRDPGQLRWGFELAVLDVMARQAGTIIVTDAVNTQLSDNPGADADYLKQTDTGTYDNTPNGPVTWAFDWVAPEAGDVTFYIAGNAANSNNNPMGDFVYAIQRPVAPVTAIGPVALAPVAVLLLPSFPNPFPLAATIPFELGAAGRMRLTIHDVRGRLLRTLVDAALPAGTHAAIWDGRDGNGREAPRGVYFVRLRSGGGEARQRLVHAD